MQHQEHLRNIDWIRAICSILVVALHYDLIAPSSTINGLTPEIWLRNYVMGVAVPLFMLVSLFLMTRKKRELAYLKQRSQKLLFIGIIWPFIYYTCNSGIIGYVERIILSVKEMKELPLRFFYYVFSNIDTIYYFFVSLLIVVVVSFYLQNKSNKFIYCCLAINLIIIAILPLTNIEISVVYNPMNFLPYAPIAILINRNFDKLIKQKVKFGLALLIIGLFLMLLEVEIASNTGILFIEGYTKNSLVFLATGIFVLSFAIQSTNKTIKFMSEYSLALYLIHPCMFRLAGTISNIIFIKALKLTPAYISVGSFMVAMSLCYVVAKFIMPRILHPAIYSSS
jgi:peptidoglycan/LPS O-acetylase OafA/YrhL